MSEVDQNKYVCICGKHFDNAQSFNAHKTNCSLHQINKYGNLDKLNLTKAKRACSFRKSRQIKSKLIKNQKRQQWISEQHTCERCGKIMTEKYGSGRFCSKTCATSRPQSEETKQKISQSVKSYLSTTIKSNKQSLIKRRYFTYINGDQLITKLQPIDFNEPGWVPGKLKSIMNKQYSLSEQYRVQKEQYSVGYLHNRRSYAENFWKAVLDNNHISYIEQYQIKSPNKRGVYKLDFFITDLDLDLEIDGALHEQCVEKDLQRTEYLSSIGITTYRIKWINPDTKTRSDNVQQQINELLEYIQNRMQIKS